MTAVNVLIGPDRVSLYTDSAALALTGALRKLVSKTRALPAMRCAIAVRGELRALAAAEKILPTVGRDYDQLRAAAEDGRLQTALGRRRALSRGNFGLLVPFDLVVAGWSASGPKAFIVCINRRMRFDGTGDELKSKAAFDIPWATIMPTVSMTPAMREDPAGSMPTIMDLQHKHREPWLLTPEGRIIVGGFVEETTVTASGVSIQRVGGWDDVIGKPIGGGNGHRRALLCLMALIAGTSFASWLTFVVVDVIYMLISGSRP